MADTTNPNAGRPAAPTAPAAAPAAAAAPQTILVEANRDYWPHERPKNLPEDVEYRVRVGERVELPVEEAMDVVERGIGSRVRRDDILKG